MQNSSELGYLLSVSDLNSGSYDEARTSVRALAAERGIDGKYQTINLVMR